MVIGFLSIEQEEAQCDGSLSSFIEVGLKVVLQKLLQHDMDTAVTMLINMVGYNVKEGTCLQSPTIFSRDWLNYLYLQTIVEDVCINFRLIQVFHDMLPLKERFISLLLCF